MIKTDLSWDWVMDRLEEIDYAGNKVYGIPKGGMIAAGFLKNATCVPTPEMADIILDDVLESGRTMDIYKKKYPDKQWYVLLNKNVEYGPGPKPWFTFPWERQHPMEGDASIEDSIVRILQYLGEDTKREGLVMTPKRVVRSWKELFAGYNQKIEDFMTVFDAEGASEIVLLKDIEFYSTCEHHFQPIIGKAHVAYIPGKKIVGISKLARLVDMYARRLQNQERITNQVVEALAKTVAPLGAACIIEAQHMCTCSRGVGKQSAVMVTSSVAGRFTNDSAKQELMKLIKF